MEHSLTGPSRVTGFAHLDGPIGAPWPPPRPRGVAWTLILFALLIGALAASIVALAIGYAIAVHFAAGHGRDWRLGQIPVWAALALASIALTAPFLMQAWLRDKRPPAALGLVAAGWRPALAWCAFALALNVPLAALNCAEAKRWDLFVPALAAMVPALPVFILQGGGEEVIFRGWMFQTIAARHGALIGLIASSLVFALMHINPAETPLGMMLGALMRLPLAFALAFLALRYGNLGSAIALHAGWNAGQFGAVVVAARVNGRSAWDGLLDTAGRTRLGDVLSWDFAAPALIIVALAGVVIVASPSVRAGLRAPS